MEGDVSPGKDVYLLGDRHKPVHGRKPPSVLRLYRKLVMHRAQACARRGRRIGGGGGGGGDHIVRVARHTHPQNKAAYLYAQNVSTHQHTVTGGENVGSACREGGSVQRAGAWRGGRGAAHLFAEGVDEAGLVGVELMAREDVIVQHAGKGVHDVMECAGQGGRVCERHRHDLRRQPARRPEALDVRDALV